MTRPRVIGRGGQLPWRLSADLKRFKRMTMGHHLIMGRKTFKSIGRALPGRTSIVLSRNPTPDLVAAAVESSLDSLSAGGIEPAKVLLADSLDEALDLARSDEEVFVIGGGEVYRIALPRVQRLHITWVDADVAGDTYFPDLDLSEWRLVSQEEQPADARNEYPHRFAVYDRIA